MNWLHYFAINLNFINFVSMDNKALVNILSDRLGRSTDDIENALDSLCYIIVETVREGDTVAIPGFGQFESKLKTERVAVHPSNGSRILVPPKISMVFKPSALLKQRIKNS